MTLRLLILLLPVLFFGCSEVENHGIYNEGRLEYRISYLNAEKDNYDPSFLPKKMTLEFNQDYSINIIDGFMGLFKLGNITYFKNQKVKTHLKVLDKNYAVDGKRNDMMCCFDCLEGMILKEDTSTKIMGGLKSKKVEVSFKNNNEKYDIYFTEDINLSHPNSTNPYHDINGVLTEFRLKMGPYLMLFTTIKFDPLKKPNRELKFPDDVIEVNHEEMVAILNRLMEQNL